MSWYTSNYARKGRDENAIAISVKPPDWYQGNALPIVAPTWELVLGVREGRIDEREYTSRYLQLLEVRNVDSLLLVETLPDTVYFLCYEKPTDFCHRHVFARWLSEKTGIEISEWENEQERKISEQQAIVDNLLSF